MARRLSPATSLDTLRREAKRWLKRLRSNDPDARARLARALPQIPAAPRIRDVQLALAREHGCAGWIALKAAVDRNIRQVQPGMDLIRPDELASVEPYGPWRSRGRDVWDALQAARVGDNRTLQRLLARDPNLARYPEPLHFAVREGHAAIVGTLLAAGADPDGLGAGSEDLATIARDRGHDELAQISRALAAQVVGRGQRLREHPTTRSTTPSSAVIGPMSGRCSTLIPIWCGARRGSVAHRSTRQWPRATRP